MWSRFVLITFCCSVVFLAQFGDAAIRSKREDSDNVVEVLVAVDKGMVEHYGDDLDDVIKSSVYQQSRIYEKSNLKQKVSISLVDIIQLPIDPSEGADVPGKDDGKNSAKMLDNFCKYVAENSSLKYDTAIYITRTKIYSNSNRPHGISGLANIGAMCTRRACLILSYSYIPTYVAAHEIGHVFGCSHDGDCDVKYPKPTKTVLMTKYVGQAAEFSDCSLNTFDEFFKKDESKCLLEQTSPNLLSSFTFGANKKLFDPKTQCLEWLKDEMDTNRNVPVKDCAAFWCFLKTGYTTTNGGPWLENTPCGDGKVCRDLKCVDE